MRAMAMAVLLMTGSLGAQDLAAAKAEFQKWDKELNAVYGQLKKELNEAHFEKVREDQRNWVGHRDYIAKWESEAQGRTPAEDANYWKTAAGLTESRVAFLRAWKGVGESGSWTGVYRDSYGGLIEMVERNGKLYFTINVVRGPTYHVGEIAGVAEVNGGMARFSVAEEGVERPTWLTFLNNREGDGRVEVIGENTQWFHGARAYFDGKYLRVGLLSGKKPRKL